MKSFAKSLSFFFQMRFLHLVPQHVCPPVNVSVYWLTFVTELNTKIQNFKNTKQLVNVVFCLFTSVAELRCSQHKRGNRVSLAFSSKEWGQKQTLNVLHLIMEKDCKTLLMLFNLGGIGFQTPNPNLGPKHTPLKFL